MRWARDQLALLAAVVLLGISGGASAANAYVAQPSDPPECIAMNIVDDGGAGATIYAEWCGFGSEGISPMKWLTVGKGPLVVDGADLSPADCTRASRCSVFWILSPQTGR